MTLNNIIFLIKYASRIMFGGVNMKISNLFGLNTIILQLKSEGKDQVLEELIYKFYKANRLYDLEEFKKEIFRGDKNFDLTCGIAIVSVNTKAVRKSSIVIARSYRGITFKDLDGQLIKLFFLLGTIEGSETKHLEILEKLTEYVRDEEFTEKLLESYTKEEILEIIHIKDRV